MPLVTNREAPHFLGLGVMRGGSTWLWKQLAQHPDVWLPPVKELNYFTRRHPIRIPAEHGDGHRNENQPHLFRQSLKRFRWDRLSHYFRTYSPASIAWRWRFYRGPVGPEWYRSLFEPAGDRLAGDITPHYSALGDDGVAEVAEFLPRTKAILILRDPIDRDWSHAVHWLTTGVGMERDSITEADVVEHSLHPSVRSRGDYLPILERWQGALPPERLKVCFYDDIQNRPGELLEEIEAFLGLPPFRPAGLEDRVNRSYARAVPPSVERHLARLHLPALEILAERFSTPCRTWLEHARAALG